MKFVVPVLIALMGCTTESALEVPAGYGALRIQTPTGPCSGVAISAREFLTAAHCVDDLEFKFLVTRAGGETNEARAVKVSASADVALLELVDGEDFTDVVEAWQSAPVARGDALTYVGFGCETAVRTGEMVGVLEDDRVELAGEVCAGDSGGPVFAGGELIGLVVSRVEGGGYVEKVEF
jgi:V8-like Glu-specific endopeptidase